MEDDTAAEDRAVGGVKEEEPVGDTAARIAVNVAATARRADFVMLEAVKVRMSLLEKYGPPVHISPSTPIASVEQVCRSNHVP